MNITVLGGGAWGTAIALSAANQQGDHAVCLWARDPKAIEAMRSEHQNKKYLPAITLPSSLILETYLEKAIGRIGADDLLVIATPMSALAAISKFIFQAAKHPLNILLLCKGLEPKTALLAHQVLQREIGRAHV